MGPWKRHPSKRGPRLRQLLSVVTILEQVARVAGELGWDRFAEQDEIDADEEAREDNEVAVVSAV
jgi:hypothetical protein